MAPPLAGPNDPQPPERWLDDMHKHAGERNVTVSDPTGEQTDIVVGLLAHQRAASLPGWPERSNVSTQ